MSFHSSNDTIAHSEQYGQGYYLGKVINNQDPEGLHRIQADVPGLYDSSAGEVPWIAPHPASPFGIGVGYGTYGSPAVDSDIKIELQNGDEHNALYSPVQTKAGVNANFSDPNVWGFKDPSGNTLRVDMTAGTWVFTHASGDIMSYDIAGNKMEVIAGTMTINVIGRAYVTSETRIDAQAPIITLNTVPVI